MPHLLYQFVNGRPVNNSKEVYERTQAHESIYQPQNILMFVILLFFFSLNKKKCKSMR